MIQSDYKSLFLKVLIGALSVSAVIGIFIFLAGDFAETETRLLLTTLAITGFSLTGMCCSMSYNRALLKKFSILGMIISILGCLVTIATIWEGEWNEGILKITFIFMILSFSLAHISLLFLIRPKTDKVRYGQTITIIFIAIVALMLIVTTIDDFESGETFYRMLGIFAIVDVCGTLVTPILNKIAE